jgi:hypothetical protein
MRQVPFNGSGAGRLEVDEEWLGIDEQNIVWMRGTMEYQVRVRWGERIELSLEAIERGRQ